MLEKARHAKVLLHLALFLSYEAVDLVTSLNESIEDESKLEERVITEWTNFTLTIDSLYELINGWVDSDSTSLDRDEEIKRASELFSDMYNQADLMDLLDKMDLFKAAVELDQSAQKLAADPSIRTSPMESNIKDSNFYSTLLNNASQPSGAREIIMQTLQIILVAEHPLTIGSIDALLGTKNEELLVNALSGVIGIATGGIITIIDPIFRDFLHDKETAGSFYIDEVQSHSLMARSCFAVMMQELTFNICRIDSSFVRNNEIPNMNEKISSFISSQLQYAAIHWHKHLIQSGEESHGSLSDMLGQFSTSPYPLYWMEVISALGKVRGSLCGLQDARDWLLDAQTKERVEDIHRFIVWFYTPISESIPHIYISSIPFGARDSILVQESIEAFPRTLSVTQGYLKQWKTHPNILEGSRPISAAVFSPNGRQIASCSDRTIQLWDVETGQALGEPLRGHRNRVTSVSFSPDGHRIASGSHDHTIRLWDAETGQALGEPLRSRRNRVTSVSFSPDGRRIASGLDDYTIRLWDAETGRALGEPLRGRRNWVTSVSFSPDGRRIASGSDDYTIRLRDAETLGELLRDHEDRVNSVSFSPDGRQIASGSHDDTIQLWDAETGQALGKPLRGHRNQVTSISFSPDGRRVASGSRDVRLRLWDAETGQALGEPLRDHQERVTSVSFSPDGRQIASGSYDKTIRFWDAKTGQALGEPLRGHKGWVTSVSFSPDGRRIASGSRDNTIRLWDAETGQALGEPLRGHKGWVTSVSFSPDGRQIASGSYDETIRLWYAETGQALGERPPDDHQSSSLSSNELQTSHSAIARSGWKSSSNSETIKLMDQKTGRILVYWRHVPGEASRLVSARLEDNGWVMEGDRLLHWVPPSMECSIDITQFRCGRQWKEVHEVEGRGPPT
ncbi:hypothetical protein FRC19_006795 [Serendipita sp. 401]|nr:hypothetical protein FRC19_006795 [Serendipita sp. 401]